MEDYINLARKMGLRVISDGAGVLVKGLDWTSKPIKHEAHFKNLLLKTVKITAPQIKERLATLRRLMKNKPTQTVKIAYSSLYETVKTLTAHFPDMKF